MAEWHGFAKLRMHTDSTLKHLEELTPVLGNAMRKFRDTSATAFTTFELPREQDARMRRKQSDGNEASSRKIKKLNLSTYKWHALGDYVAAIRLFGGTDGFSTQLVTYLCYIYGSSHTHTGIALQGELAHKVVKRLYGLTNKRHAESQIGRRYRRLERARLAGQKRKLSQIRASHRGLATLPPSSEVADVIFNELEGDSDLRYHISPSKNLPIQLFSIIGEHCRDPAYDVNNSFSIFVINIY